MKSQVVVSQTRARIPAVVDETTSTVSFRINNDLLAALNAKARSKSLSRTSLIILGIHQVLDPHTALGK